MTNSSSVVENRPPRRHNWHDRKVKFAGNFDKEPSSSRQYRRKSPAFIKFDWVDEDIYDESEESEDHEHGAPKTHHWHLHRKTDRSSFFSKPFTAYRITNDGEPISESENPFLDPSELDDNRVEFLNWNNNNSENDELFDYETAGSKTDGRVQRQLWPFRKGGSNANRKGSFSRLRIRHRSNEQ